MYSISKAAETDLENIWLFSSEKWSLAQADRYLNLILDEIEHIASHPTFGIDYNPIRKGYYASRVKSHFIFYRINQEQVEIVRILHQKMDIASRIKHP